MIGYEELYKQLLDDVLEYGERCKEDRTGVGTIRSFGKDLTVDLADGFPFLTGKKLFFEKALGEFVWMYLGKNDLETLHVYGIKWWDKFSADGKTLTKSYGSQIRAYNGTHDQINFVRQELLKGSRRAVVTLWNPSDLGEQELPCCFVNMVFSVIGGRLNLLVTFRSSDLFLGLPYDMAVMALFATSLAKAIKVEPGYLKVSISDAHIYKNHVDQVKEYLDRPIHKLPTLQYVHNDIYLDGYVHEPIIKAPLNVGRL